MLEAGAFRGALRRNCWLLLLTAGDGAGRRGRIEFAEFVIATRGEKIQFCTRGVTGRREAGLIAIEDDN